jgi:hypothetical protein
MMSVIIEPLRMDGTSDYWITCRRSWSWAFSVVMPCGHYAAKSEVDEYDNEFLGLVEDGCFDDTTHIPFTCSVCCAVRFYLSATRLQFLSMRDMIYKDRRMHPK